MFKDEGLNKKLKKAMKSWELEQNRNKKRRDKNHGQNTAMGRMLQDFSKRT